MGIKFIENDSEKIISSLIAQFEKALGETLQPSDERRIFLYQLAQIVVGIKSDINDTGNQVLLRYARGEALDAIGEMFGVTRLPASFAKCTLEFTLSEKQAQNVVVPSGTRATPDEVIYFATDDTLIIPAGSLSGQVTATATVAGANHNGYVEEQIKYIVDKSPYLAKVRNTNVSSGGTEIESDDNFRERIRLVPESFSTAGCVDGYIYWAKSASADVGDVAVHSPSAGLVDIYILKADGTIPTSGDELLNIVYQSVNAKDRRPLTDKVTVLPPSKVNYSINLNYYISSENEINTEDIRKRVDESVSQYVKWQSEKIGRDINPDKLRNLILNAGASRVVMTNPTFTAINNTHIASLDGEIIASYAGISE